MDAVKPFASLYLHIPFCRSKCLYCDFESLPVGRAGCAGSLDSYLDVLSGLVARAGDDGLLRGVRTVYVGGGTPSLAGERLADLVRLVRSYCDPDEFTCEANPESLSAGLASQLVDAGVTRLSLGVQSLQDVELASIGRIHSADLALSALMDALACGLDVSCDLMCGLPGQTLESWSDTLDRLLGAGFALRHVSVYPLQLEDGTPLERMEARGDIVLPDEDFQAACMDLAALRLESAGFSRYEVASYAREGAACAHNVSYWTGESYLGIGRSAAGMIDRGSDGRTRFVQLDDAGERYDVERLSAREAVAEDLMLACRMSRGISAALLERAKRVIPVGELDCACERAVELGLARWRSGSLEPTHLGWLDGNQLFGLFWGLAGE